jgi:hypothetical protein
MSNAIVTTERVVRATPPNCAPPPSAKLRAIHRRWMDETSDWLNPTLAPDADFWNGWSAVRYVNDQFDRQYRRGWALVAAILPLLRPADAFMLCARSVVLERTRRDLDRLGRQRGTTEVVAALAHRLLKLLRSWFSEIERVTEDLTIDDLPLDGRRALAQLRTAVATWQ